MVLRRLVLGCTAFLVTVLLLPACGRKQTGPPDEAVRHLNLGIALLEQHKFGEAEKAFTAALAAHPGYFTAEVNLALAYAAQVKYTEAQAVLQKVIRPDLKEPTPLYMSGLIHKYKGEKEQARAAFERVLALDPADTDTRYNLATLYKDQGDFTKAIPMLESVIEAAPHFVSAYYALGQAYLRRGQEVKDPTFEAKGRGYIERFQQLSGGATAETAGLRYGEQGRYSMAIEESMPGPAPAPVALRFVEGRTSGIDFTHDAGSGPQAGLGSGVLVHDVDGDGVDDILLLGPSGGQAARLYRNDGKGRFEDRTAPSGLGEIRGGATGVAAGDADGDGALDFVLGGHFLRGDGKGAFTDATAAAGLDPSALDSAASTSFADLDHDGDLEIILTTAATGGVRVWQNDGKAQFTEITPTTGMGGDYPARSLVFTDYDNDRDIDAVIGVEGAPPRIYSNNRDLTFTEVGARAQIDSRGPTRGIATADLDGDGFPDLLVTNTTERTHTLFHNRRDRTFAPMATLATAAHAGGCLFFDADLDGDLDLALGETTGIRYFRNDGGALVEATVEVGLDAVRGDIRGLAAGDLDGDGDSDLVANVHGGRALVLLGEGAASNNWVKVALRGTNTNRTGLGTKVEIRAGRLHQKVEAQGASGFLSQSLGTITFGLEGKKTIDRVRLLWPGGVLQSELDVPPGKLRTIEELDRKGSSCPFLWAWNGEEVAFVSDVQGGSPLGLWLAPGVTNLPDPDEWFLLPAGAAEPRDGAYDLRITESLEEVCYIDRAMLRVIDAPAGVTVMPNERLLLAPPFAAYGLHFLRDLRPPKAAHDGAGGDVLHQLTTIDRGYAGAMARDRFRGFARPWALELDFGTLAPAERTRPVVLVAHGYVEFSNSTPMFAAAQAGLHFELPALDVLDDHGRVLTTIADAGAPAGLPKSMVLDLTGKLPRSGRVHLRYRTNMEVYFDQVQIGIGDPAVPHTMTDLEPQTADLRFAGYPRPWSPDGRKPVLYRYDNLLPDETWAEQEGLYTRAGDVRPLLAGEDDRLVVMTHGDELKLRFPTATLTALPPGWNRHLVLYSVGYAKDLDLHSAAPLTVGPLPFRAMTRYPYDGPGPFADPAFTASLATWSTRHVRSRSGTLR